MDILPKEVRIEVSHDGKRYTTIADTTYVGSKHWGHKNSEVFKFDFKPIKARYLKVTALSIKTCPQWHNAYGQPSWIFADEIIVY